MNVSIHLSDEAQPEVRDAIVGPLVAYNTQRTGTNVRVSSSWFL